MVKLVVSGPMPGGRSPATGRYRWVYTFGIICFTRSWFLHILNAADWMWLLVQLVQHIGRANVNCVMHTHACNGKRDVNKKHFFFFIKLDQKLLVYLSHLLLLLHSESGLIGAGRRRPETSLYTDNGPLSLAAVKLPDEHRFGCFFALFFPTRVCHCAAAGCDKGAEKLCLLTCCQKYTFVCKGRICEAFEMANCSTSAAHFKTF